ncbi:hypothetical protein BC829DRAFT_364176, partial [Chytridium lagenaria]
WVPEVKYFAPTIPLILVGCKVDLREDPDAVDRLARSGDVPVAIEEAQDVAREIGAFKYVETSAKLGFQIQNLFDDEVDDSGEYVEDEKPLRKKKVMKKTKWVISLKRKGKKKPIPSSITTNRLSLK